MFLIYKQNVILDMTFAVFPQLARKLMVVITCWKFSPSFEYADNLLEYFSVKILMTREPFERSLIPSR